MKGMAVTSGIGLRSSLHMCRQYNYVPFQVGMALQSQNFVVVQALMYWTNDTAVDVTILEYNALLEK